MFLSVLLYLRELVVAMLVYKLSTMELKNVFFCAYITAQKEHRHPYLTPNFVCNQFFISQLISISHLVSVLHCLASPISVGYQSPLHALASCQKINKGMHHGISGHSGAMCSLEKECIILVISITRHALVVAGSSTTCL